MSVQPSSDSSRGLSPLWHAHGGGLTGKGARTRQTILAVATAHFAASGFRGVSVPSIARAVEVSPSAIYSYFPSKSELYEAAVDADVSGLIADALPEVLEGRFEPDFARVFRRLTAALGRHPLARRVLEGNDAGAELLAVLPAEIELRRSIAHAIRSGQDDGTVRGDIEPDVMAAGLEAVVIALLMALLQTGGPADADQARGVVAVLEAALRPSS